MLHRRRSETRRCPPGAPHVPILQRPLQEVYEHGISKGGRLHSQPRG